MASKHAVIIGGTGLIGSYLTADLVRAGHRVSVLSRSTRFSAPEALLERVRKQIEVIHGEHSDESLLVDVLSKADVIFHKTLSLGASGAVENGQQFLQNKLGAACALTAALRRLKHKPELLVLGSSIAVYGEGAYECTTCGTVRPELRYALDQQGDQRYKWNPHCPNCRSQELTPVFLDEKGSRRGESIYAVEKKAEEDLIAAACKQTEINLSVLRYSTVIGAGQSWHSPFTHFLDVLHAGEQPVVHEDGQQTRDFIFVRDAAAANMKALEKHPTGVNFYNVASGEPRQMLEFLQELASAFKGILEETGVQEKDIPNYARTDLKLMPGDVRHCHVSGAKAENELEFATRQDFRQGLTELVEWYSTKKGIGTKRA